MFLVNRQFKIHNYNIKHANKVHTLYTTLTNELHNRKIFGTRCVDIRHKEMMKSLQEGIFSIDEYKNWKVSQKIV
jgi:hypothetical protein